MNKYLLSATAVAVAQFMAGPGVAATPPISTVACTAAITGCAFAADGSFPAEGQQYQQQTAWWFGLTQSVTYALLAPQIVTGFVVSLDNNDTYQFDVSSDGANWTALTQVPANAGEVGSGMDTFSTEPSSPEFVSGIAFAPTAASFVRIRAIGGDNQYSVGELTVLSAVPEPGAAILLAAGAFVLSRVRSRVKRSTSSSLVS